MSKLPLCPHCGARFLYRDVKEHRTDDVRECPHCKQKFTVHRRRNAVILYGVLFLLLVGMDLLLLNAPGVGLWLITVLTAVCVGASWFLLPFTVRYKKPENEGTAQSNKKTTRKNA